MKYVCKRILMLLVTMVIVSLLAFAAFELIHGSAAEIMLGTQATPDRVAELEAQHAAKEPQLPKYEGVATLIDIEPFGKVDLRVAQIKECVPVKRAKKLLKLQLDDGFAGGRQVVSGIAPWYKPEDLIGKKVIIAANLQPVKLCGEESSGMILATDLPDGNVQVIFVDDSVPNGSKLR